VICTFAALAERAVDSIDERASPSQAKDVAKLRSIAAYNASTATAPPEAVKRWTEKPAALANVYRSLFVDMPCPVRLPRLACGSSVGLML